MNKLISFLFAFSFCVSSVFSQSHIHPSQAEELFSAAKLTFASSNYAEAIGRFEEVTAKFPQSIYAEESTFLQGECLMRLQRTDEAKQQYIRLLRDYPASRFTPDAETRLGELSYTGHSFHDAIEYYKDVLEVSHENTQLAQASFFIGTSFAGIGDSVTALKYLLLANDYSPASVYGKEALYNAGEIYRATNRFDEAVSVYDQLLSNSPEKTLAECTRVQKIETLYSQHKYAQAKNVLDSLQFDSQNAEIKGRVLLLSIRVNIAMGNYSTAEGRCEQFLRAFPKDVRRVEVSSILGALYYKQNKYLESEEVFREVAEGNYSTASYAKLYLAKSLKQTGKKQESQKIFEEFARDTSSPFSVYGLFEMALNSFTARHYEEARTQLNNVLERTNRPSLYLYDSSFIAECYRIYGEVLFAEGNFPESRAFFAKAQTVASFDDSLKQEALLKEGWCLYNLKQFDEAAKCFQYVVKKRNNPSDGTFFWLAESYYRAGNFPEAKRYYSQITERFPQSPKYHESLLGYGWSSFALKDYENAEKAFEKTLLDEPTGTMAFEATLRLGDAYFYLKNYRNAATAYRNAIEKFPDEQGRDYAAFQLGQTLYRAGSVESAIDQLRSLQKQFPASQLLDEAQFAIGWILFQEKQYTRAIASFEVLLTKFPASSLAARANVQIGDAYYNTTEYEKAVLYYQKVLKDYPQAGVVSDALRGIGYCYSMQDNDEEARRITDEFYKNHPEAKKDN